MRLSDGKKKAAVLLFAGTILILQFFATFAPVVNKRMGMRYWPITDYPMYKEYRSEGDHINVRYIVEVETQGGGRISVTPETSQLGFWRYLNTAAKLVHRKNPDQKLIDPMLQQIDENQKPVAIEIFNYPLILTKEGAKESESLLLRRIELE